MNDEPGPGAAIWIEWRGQQALVASIAALPVQGIVMAISAMEEGLLREVITLGLVTYEPKALLAWRGIIARTLAQGGGETEPPDDEDDRRLAAAVIFAHREGAERVERWRREAGQ